MTHSTIDESTFDNSVRPQDDLYQHVNGGWLDATEIPQDRSRYGVFLKLQEESEQAVQGIIEAAAKRTDDPTAQQIGALYASFMDEAAIESKGTEPIDAEIAEALAVSSIADVTKLLGKYEARGLGNIFGLFVDSDPGNPERYVLIVVQSGLGLPDEAYYREDQYAEIRAAYRKHIEYLLSLAGVSDAVTLSHRVFDLETQIASHHWNIVDRRDAEKTYNLLSSAELHDLTPGFDWSTFLTAAEIPQDKLGELVVSEPSALTGITSLLSDEHLADWRAWLVWRVIHSAAALLSSPFVNANFEFYGKTLSGTPELRARWKRGVSIVEAGVGEAVGKLYVEQYFPPESKDKMDRLVSYLIEAYRQSITTLSWMTPTTRQKALEKLDAFTPKIGYPVKWRDYSTLTLTSDDLVGNLHAIAAFDQHRELAKLGNPIDRDEWFMTPQTINAYYNPGFNEIVFPAAILQSPFFDPEADAAENFGAIGSVIGHEIGHGFDDQGSKFDGTGALVDWWTPEDRKAFEERTASLIAQYSALHPTEAPQVHVNGELTIGENIGDLGGLGIAWKAYLLSLDGQEPPVIDGRTGAERFFLAWANVWREKRRAQEAERLVAIDPHSPTEFRCNQVVKNLDIFHETFGTKKGDQMWIDPEDRVAIWA